MGFIKDLRNFDASFFGSHPRLAERMDPIVRILLETSVEAVMDAGTYIIITMHYILRRIFRQYNLLLLLLCTTQIKYQPFL